MMRIVFENNAEYEELDRKWGASKDRVIIEVYSNDEIEHIHPGVGYCGRIVEGKMTIGFPSYTVILERDEYDISD